MASKKNDALTEFTIAGSVNYYDELRSKATAFQKCQASLISGHRWNIINNTEENEVFFRGARNADHFVDCETKMATSKWWLRKRRNRRTLLQAVDDNGILPKVHDTPRKPSLRLPALSASAMNTLSRECWLTKRGEQRETRGAYHAKAECEINR
eukprot:GEMP01067165.1.p1 GENE.GEMP01067165.1~~GEMP01067165.1.p1  ORF type:complete len:154 (+),score=35.59 GEMP01067165.1:109-570(+)